MYQPVYTKQFRKDIKRVEKSGNKDIEKLKEITGTGNNMDTSHY